jgi:nicotinate-nucleotide pyrophosphorylase (carboxylating)
MIVTPEIRRIIEGALREDIGSGDVTTGSVLTGREKGRARAVAKADMVIAGIQVFKEVFLAVDPEIRFLGKLRDGQPAKRGDTIAEVSGRLSSILQAERVALNFFQRMCGVATLTRNYVDRVMGTKAKILDTRKTAPGLRVLDKYAVKAGGGHNHRFALYDGVLIKDNHITAAGGITPAVRRAADARTPTLKIEVEVKNLKEAEEALKAGADMIMLDNMSLKNMEEAVRFIAGKVPVEASGNISILNVREVAETGVDYISAGALTHSVSAADISIIIT